MIRKDLIIPIYDAEVTVAVTKKFEDVVLEAGYKEDVAGNTAITLHYPDNPLKYVVVFKKGCVSHGAIAHEACHLTQKLMNDVDIEHDYKNDEAEAYLIGFIVDGIHQIIYKDE